MQSRKLVRIIALILVFVLVLTFVISAVSYMASAAPSETEIESLSAENEEIARKITEVESIINSFEYDTFSLLEQKELLDELVILAETEIMNLNKQIGLYDLVAEELKVELDAAKADEKKKLSSVTNRIRAFEENGILAYLSPVFEAEDFLDFLGRVDLMKTVLEYDSWVFGTYSGAKDRSNYVMSKMDGLEGSKDGIRQIISEKEAERDKRVSDAEEFLLDIEGKQSVYELFCVELEAGQKAFESVIANKKAEQIRLSPQIQPGTGAFAWPVNSSNVVSMTFGTKLNSEYNMYRVHNGIDIAADYGSTVTAADGGMVTAADYDPVYGNYVVINHGNGYETLYAQLACIYVEEGQQLTAGTAIAGIGATGYATEQHLHCEIRLNGTSENPLTYYTGYKVND